MHRIVVGVDFSDGSIVALRWAASISRTVRAPIRLVSAWEYPWWWFLPEPQGNAALPQAEDVRAVVEGQVADLVVAEGLIDVDLDVAVGHGVAAQVLVGSCGPDDLLVVGSRGHNAAASSLLGSVSATAAATTACPIALVPQTRAQPDGIHRMAVGIDGSDNSFAALDWVMHHSGPSSDLLVVAAWCPPAPHVSASEVDLLAQHDCARAHTAGAEAARRLASAGLRCRVLVQEGDPRSVLAAAGAQMGIVVVGARGHGQDRQPFLGSVTTDLVRHPDCVVVAVPPTMSG